METSNLDVASMVASLIGGEGGKAPVPKTTAFTEDQLRFGNWTGQKDTKVMAQDLMKRGLIGADQLLNDQVDVRSGDKIRNAQSDWKVAALSNILSNARRLNIRSKEEYLANKNVLIGNSRWAEGINSDVFKRIHKNWDDVTFKILQDQYLKHDKT